MELLVRAFQTAFPGAEIPQHDSVAARWDLRGAHKGTFMGVPPTGKQVSVDGIIIYRLERQKIVEYWGVFDTLSLMRQLGVAIG